MAGEWIKLEHATEDKPEVLRMARRLKLDRDLVLGKLVRFWCWLDANCVDGVVDGVVSTDVDALVSQDGFAAALEAVGWLECDDTHECIRIPNFDDHNSESAKKRALKGKRQTSWRRKRDASVDGPVDAPPSTPASTREEKRREEKQPTTVSGEPSGSPDPPDVRKPVNGSRQVTEAGKRILALLNERTGRHYQPVEANLRLICARIREYDEDTVRKVTQIKCYDWLDDEKMSQFLRPATLYNATKFAQYAGEIRAGGGKHGPH